MNKYAKEYSEKVFSQYKENSNLTEANVIHLYKTSNMCKGKTGYADAIHFRWVAYNTVTMEFRSFDADRYYDGMDFPCGVNVRFFVDGSVAIRSSKMLILEATQCPYLK